MIKLTWDDLPDNAKADCATYINALPEEADPVDMPVVQMAFLSGWESRQSTVLEELEVAKNLQVAADKPYRMYAAVAIMSALLAAQAWAPAYVGPVAGAICLFIACSAYMEYARRKQFRIRIEEEAFERYGPIMAKLENK